MMKRKKKVWELGYMYTYMKNGASADFMTSNAI